MSARANRPSTERNTQVRTRTKQIAAVAALAAVGTATFAATGMGRSESPEPRIDIADPMQMKVVRTERLSLEAVAQRGLAVASKKVKVGLKTSYLVGTTPIPVSPRSGTVVPLTCPGKTIPLSGGMRNDFVAVVENSSSQTAPAGAPAADWYEGAT